MKSNDILGSWKEIAAYLERNTRTCIRWSKDLGLPVRRINGESPRSKVFAYKSEIDRWFQEKSLKKALKKKPIFENNWVSIGLASGLVILFTIFSFLFFTHNPSPPPLSEITTIAVLPLESQRTSRFDEYFDEQLTVEINNNLSRLKMLKTVPYSSVSRYNSQEKDIQEISSELDVDYVLSGDIEKTENKIKLTMNLYNTEKKEYIWNEELDQSLKVMSSLPDQVCHEVSKVLNMDSKQKFPEPAEESMTSEFKSYDTYLKGCYVLNRLKEENEDPWKLYHHGKVHEEKGLKENNEFAISLFKEVTKTDPTFALAYIGLAQCYANYINFDWDKKINYLNIAENYVTIAQKNKPDMTEYYSTLAEINLLKYLEFDSDTKDIAFDLLKEGLKKYPYDSKLISLIGYCHFLIFGEEGRESDFKKALNYKENSFLLTSDALENIVYAELLMLNRNFETALYILDNIREKENLMIDFLRGEIYYYSGELDKSESIFHQFEVPLKYRIGSLFYLGMIASQKGEKEKSLQIIEEIKNNAPDYSNYYYQMASIYLGAGQQEEGYKNLRFLFEKNKSTRFIFHRYIELDENFDKCRKDKEFIKIINE